MPAEVRGVQIIVEGGAEEGRHDATLGDGAAREPGTLERPRQRGSCAGAGTTPWSQADRVGAEGAEPRTVGGWAPQRATNGHPDRDE